MATTTATKFESTGRQEDGSFIVPAGFETEIFETAKKINARAARKGYAAGEGFRVEIVETGLAFFKGKKFEPAIRLVILAPVPHVEGYEFVAAIEHHGGKGNVVYAYSSEHDAALKGYRSADSNCEHCRVNRRRNDTFILRSVENVTYIQVGRTCLKDFTSTDPAEALRLWDMLRTLSILAAAEAAEVLAWIESIDPDTDSNYLHNLRMVAALGYVNARSAGVFSSAVSVVRRNKAEAIRKSRVRSNLYVGSIGERIKADVTVIYCQVSGGAQYGRDFKSTYLIKMLDTQGNELVTWYSGDHVPEVNEAFSIAGTVKKHGEFRGEKSTTLGRVTFPKTF